MTTELTQQRTDVQTLRETIDSRERTLVDLRMVYTTLEARLERRRRDADPDRPDDRVVAHLKRLLDRHATGRRRLGYLADILQEIDVEQRLARRRRERDGDDAEVRALEEDPFTRNAMTFFDDASEGRDTPRLRQSLVETYRELVESGDAGRHAHAVAFIGVLLDGAGLALDGGVDGPVTGARTELQTRLEDHVDTLAETDKRLVGDDITDPLVTLNWSDPVAMLPVRLETRFREDVLQIRVYPEQLHVDTHEDQLTEAERQWGETFWTQLWVAGVPESDQLHTGDGLVDDSLLPDDWSRTAAVTLLRQFEAGEFSAAPDARFEEVRDRAWARGVERFGEDRASYLVDALSPVTADQPEDADVSGGDPIGPPLRAGWSGTEPPLAEPVAIAFPDVDMRPESWTQTPRARLLPDRFVAEASYDSGQGEEQTGQWRRVEPGTYERVDGDSVVRRTAGRAVSEPLAVGPSPEAVATDGDGDDGTRWMTEFDRAVETGMGIELPLPDPDETGYDEQSGFRRLVVKGVKTSMDAANSRAALADLLRASQYTDGLALLGPGTPTNNADDPAGRSSRRPATDAATRSTGPSLAQPGTDGHDLARSLGVPPAVFGAVEGAGDMRDSAAGAMNRALWPATIGYTVRNLLVPSGYGATTPDGPTGLLGTGEDPQGEGPPPLLRWLETYRDHFVSHVRGGGPFKTLRVGAQPYGVLPVAPLSVDDRDRHPIDFPDKRPTDDEEDDGSFVPASVARIDEETFVPELVRRALSLRPQWLEAGDRAPSVGTDPALSDEELLGMLSMESTASTYRRQLWLLGADNPLYRFTDLDSEASNVGADVDSLLGSVGLAGLSPRLSELLFMGVSLTSDELPVADEDVSAFIDTVVDMYAAEWPDWLLRILGTDPDVEQFRLSSVSDVELPRQAVLEALAPSGGDGDYDSTASLLRQLLRFAALQAAIASRVRIGALYGPATNEQVDFPAEPTSYGPGDSTVFGLFDDRLPAKGVSGGFPSLRTHPNLDDTSDFRDLLRTTATVTGTTTPSPDPELAGFIDALTELESVDSDRLDRLTRETMDTASHRLDAWWTSIATRRLADHRSVAGDGIQIGAFGYVENLAPEPEPDAEYLLAPSIDQATTASVLRSAHKARATGTTDGSAGALAIDCSPDQIRRARPLLDGVRNGLDLAVLLGYRFERGLRDAGLEAYIDDFREFAPAIEGQLDRGTVEASTKRSDVVDGRAVYRAWKEGRLWTAPELQLTAAERRALGGEGPDSDADGVLRAIDDAMDAVHDILVAEGVHHLSHGRPDRAAQALEALSRGKTPPEPTVVDTPRTETGVTNRLMLLFGDADSVGASGGWQPTSKHLIGVSDLPSATEPSVPETPTMDTVQVRHDGEPALEQWAGDLLPEPGRIGCSARFQWERDRGFAVGQFETPPEDGTVTVDDVGFEPDVVLLTAAVGTGEAREGATPTPATGWSHGAFRRAAGSYPAVQQATTGSVAPGGGTTYATSETDALVIELPVDGATERIEGTVVATTEEGFELAIRLSPGAAGAGTVAVQYRAFQLADPTSARIGTLDTPAAADTPSSVALSGAGTGVPNDSFDPDHVLFGGVVRGTDASGDVAAMGFSQGAVVRANDGSITQQTVGYGLRPDEQGVRVTAGADRVIGTDPGHGGGVGLTVDDLPGDGTATVTGESVGPDGYAGAVPITYVAMESPALDTPAGETRQTPVLGTVVAPEAGGTVSVETGFRPGLIEMQILGGVTSDGGDPLPVETTVQPAAAGFSIGAATGFGNQRALAVGRTADTGSRLSANGSIAALVTADADGPAAGPSLAIGSLSEDGFTLKSTGDGPDRPVVCYRVWPAMPDQQAFAAAFPGGIGVADLDLTALDAVSLTQNVQSAGDSQLERRMGYYAFRNRPVNRPPVPSDATLDLSFGDPGSAFDVSVGEYAELARSIDDLAGQARPADATDLAHSADVGSDTTGYLDAGHRGGGTADRLADRASRIESRLADVQSILDDRLTVLEPDPNICDRIETLESALRRVRRGVPVPQIPEETGRLVADHPGDNHHEVTGTILAELRTVADGLPAGPTTDLDVDATVLDKEDQRISGSIETAAPVDITVTAYSMSDSVRVAPRSVAVTTDDDGQFDAPLDFDDAPVGTEFTVIATARTDPDPGDDEWIETFFDQFEPSRQVTVLVHLAAEGVLELPEPLSENDFLTSLVPGVAEGLTSGRRPLEVLWAVERLLGEAFDPDTEDLRESYAEWRDVSDPATFESDLEELSPSDRRRLGELVEVLRTETYLDRQFEEPRPDDWTFVDEPPRSKRSSDWQFDRDDSELRQTSNLYGFEGPAFEAPGTLAVVGDREWRDYEFRTSLTSEDNDAIGVVFRYQDAENFYRFSMDAERSYRRLIRKVDDEPEILWEDEAGFEPGQTYAVTVECVGGTVTLTLDDERLCTVADDALDRGAVGLYCRANVGARFHGLTVRGRGLSSGLQAGSAPLWAADCRVLASESTTHPDLPGLIAEQRYLPRLLWLARQLPALDPAGDGVGADLAGATAAISRDAVAAERRLMDRVMSIIGNGPTEPQAFDTDDLEAVAAIVDLLGLDLPALVRSLRSIVGPVTWTGLTELVTVTGEPSRAADQQFWRAGNPDVGSVVAKDPDGEVRARLERLLSFPRTDGARSYAAYSPPIRAALAAGDIDEPVVETVETMVAEPAAVVDVLGELAPGIVDVLTGLHDLLHHETAIETPGRISELSAAVDQLRAAVETADSGLEAELDGLGVDLAALDRGLESSRDALIESVEDHRTGIDGAGQRARYLTSFATALSRGDALATRELTDRVLGATTHADLTGSFRAGVLESLRRGLLRASYFGIYGSVPAAAAGGTAADEATLVSQARSVRSTVSDRLDAGRRRRPHPTAASTVDTQTERLRALLGESFVVIPPFAPANPVELHGTLTDSDLVDDPYATDTWLHRIGRLRDLPADFQRIRTYADALGMGTGGEPGLRRRLTAGQLPHVPGQDWLGQDGVTPSGGELSLGIEFANEHAGPGPMAATPGTDGPPIAGLLIDEWVDRVPTDRETLGLGLQYDDPSARAPQSILLATPPTWSVTEEEGLGEMVHSAGPTRWTEELLRTTVDETQDLTRMRSAELDSVSDVGHLLPMLCFPDNRSTIWSRGTGLPDAPTVLLDDFRWELF